MGQGLDHGLDLFQGGKTEFLYPRLVNKSPQQILHHLRMGKQEFITMIVAAHAISLT
jgi:hypothetical protein